MLALCSLFVALDYLLGLVITLALASVGAFVLAIRQRRRGWMVAGLLGGFVACGLFVLNMIWIGCAIGGFELTFNVTVVDAETGTPIAHAEVRRHATVHTLDRNGNVVFREWYDTSRSYSIIETVTESVFGSSDVLEASQMALENEVLHIDAKGYESTAVGVGDVCDEAGWPMGNSNDLPITVKLVRV